MDGLVPIDARSLKHTERLATDLCIVGAGAAGITMARALGHGSRRVLLLESGGLEPDPATQALYQGTSVGQEYWALHTSRLRYFGGTTNHWTGWCRPLDPVDFEDRPNMLGGWPLDYEELVPYYRLAQEDCELDLLDYRAESWADRYRLSLIPLGDPFETIAWQFSPPTRFGERYRRELCKASSVQVVTHANLVSVGLAKHGGHVERLTFRALNGPTFEVEPRAVVLALGGLENPRLLLASNDVEPRGVGNRHGTVGRYFSDHPHSVVGSLVLNGDYSEAAYTGTYRLDEGTSIRFSWALSEQARRALRAPGISVTLDPMGQSATDSDSAAVHSLMEQFGAPPTSSKFELFLRAEQQPNPESRVRLSKQKDALGMPRIELDWRVPAKLNDSVREAIVMLARTLGVNSAGRVLSYLHRSEKPKHAWPTLWGGHHHIGTTRMSEDPRYGVVDRNCKVHGVDNLYCAGSSIFSTAGYANPTLTVCALARRLADHLKETYA